MSQPIGRLPVGLVSLFNLADMGAAPRLLSDAMHGTFDVLELLMLQNREQLVTAASPAIVVGGNSFAGTVPDVPPGELWYVWNYTVLVAPGAGAAANIAPTYRDNATAYLVGSYEAAAANEEARCRSAYPFWAKAGGRFGFVAKSVTLAPTAQGFLNISRFRI